MTVSPKSAAKDATVTLTVTPAEGYQLDKLTVVDKDGKGVVLTDKGNGKYTFTMPASKVGGHRHLQAGPRNPRLPR